MKLEGQPGQQGFAMAALLVSLAVMSVLMTAALPAWRHEAQREKEAELIFRGQQYARAIALFRAKNGNAFPPSVDVLVQGRYLRKKYLDPITKKDFDVISAVGAQAGAPGIQGRGAPGGPGGRGGQGAPPAPATNPLGGISAVSAGIMGVHSKSQENSIRIYNGQTRYDQWIFAFTAVNRPGGNVPGASNPGGPGAPAPGSPGSGLGGRGGRGGITPGQRGFQIPPFPGPRGGGGRGGARPPGA